MMNQNLSSYWIFYAVANAGNISKAAKELYISQPAISKSIQKLEENLGCRLFARSSRGVFLTGEGQLLYQHVKDAFETLSEGEEELRRSIELEMGHLSIGVSSTLCKHVLMPYLKGFIKRYPNISISISCQSSLETLRLLDDNKIDIGLVARSSAFKNIAFYHIADIEDTFVATPEYLSRLRERQTTSEVFEQATLMLMDKKNLTRQYINDYLTQNNMQTGEIIDISNMDLLIDFAKIGVGVACIIRSFVENELEDGSLVEIKPDIPIAPREIGFAYKEARRASGSLAAFINFFENFHQED